MPLQQLALVGMGGKAVDGVNGRAHRHILAEQPDMRCAIDDPPSGRALRCVADKDNRGVRVGKIVPQMMADASARRHAGTRHDDGAGCDAIDGHGFVARAAHFQARKTEWVPMRGKKRGELVVVGFRMPFKNIRRGRRQRRVHEHRCLRRDAAVVHRLA